MFNGDKKKTAEYCLDEFEKFIQGIRQWDCDAVSYAEIRSAALYLCEDADFERILREHYLKAKTYSLPTNASHVDFAVEATPDLVSSFFEALIEYMEAYKSKPICGGPFRLVREGGGPWRMVEDADDNRKNTGSPPQSAL